ncbi:hypothetical protein ACVW06_001135 [Pantoea ananatis]
MLIKINAIYHHLNELICDGVTILLPNQLPIYNSGKLFSSPGYRLHLSLNGCL